ncbi:2-isopropylmalate synthase 2 [Desulfamplus magnetovallimortis]|uniref:2-isopropylmalate synthase 2 n=1 Tax=Desulfamplus magnetovallimortis TaxID=1246637 RepID=A0A1W1HGX2_9BACT|nr:hypothetical protein [Desulfamplus magnetovallimortis]SLM31673.1 2-isopropylmalate synthase 2 [Desulfamplus magnetovallimortis]
MLDTTLRDGEQAPGVVFSTREKIDIATALAQAGIDEIEAGIPAMGSHVCKDIRQMARLHLPCVLSCWCRARKEDIQKAAGCNTAGVHISFPTSSILLKTIDKNETWVLDSLENLIKVARDNFDRVSIGAQDATRTTPSFLKNFSLLASELGVDRLRLADTVGFQTPSMVMGLIRELKSHRSQLELEFHAHNDLGMATANAVSAVEAGAEALSVTVNGIGERAGNASLEEVAVALFELGAYSSQINLKHITKICQLVARASRQPIPDAKPIVGKNVFRHESGIHCSGLIKNPISYQLFEPAIIGQNEMEFSIGSHSGSGAIRHLLKIKGIEIDGSEADTLLKIIRKESRRRKSTITHEELLAIYGDQCTIIQ